ncbi:hypothetical protein Tco_1121432 [Tanacetum coccineum]|uniref:Uncharacterized protein n=1 Tax=Tanacetum coccineum TaxID=301880 RepID=A0ABQ5IXR1_9ASTR
MVKITTFAVMCKAYGGEPSVDLLRSFLNLDPAGDWLTLSNREMDFRSFMMEGVDGEFNFLPEGGLNKDESPPSTKSVNNKAHMVDAEPIAVVHPSEFAENIGDSDDAPSENDEMTLIGRSKPQNLEVPPQASKVVGDPSNPLDVDSDPDIHEFPSAKELKESVDCHFVVAHVTLPSWKKYLKEINLEKLYDIHDRAYMRQAVLDNTLNRRTRKLMSALSKARASCDAIREREAEKDMAYAELERLHSEYSILVLKEKKRVNYEQTLSILRSKCKGLMSDIERLKSAKTQLLQEIDTLKQDRAIVVSKVVPHVATELVRSDEMGLLVSRLIKTALFHGRCVAFEDVANLKEPFALEKMSGYRSSSKEEFDRAGDDLANASYPLLAEVTSDLCASVEQLLSKKPHSLCSQLASSRSKPSSSKAPIV